MSKEISKVTVDERDANIWQEYRRGMLIYEQQQPETAIILLRTSPLSIAEKARMYDIIMEAIK